jgi:ADP-heptose:LPS heptosyltransferase
MADRLEPLPAKGIGYFLHFWRLRSRFPDVVLLLTNSLRGDIEAWLTRSPQRFGLVRPGRRRPLLTHAYRPAPELDESSRHQSEVWENMFRHFGLQIRPDRSPIRSSPEQSGLTIALIPGSENNPEKRWPINHWRALINGLPQHSFVLYGTPRDAPIAAAIAAGFSSTQVTDLAGRTDLVTYADHLRKSRLLVTNDTGGMHLANALGVPLIALFGPTNPLRTGPIFTAPTRVLQPPSCSPTGGGSLQNLDPKTVIATVLELTLSHSIEAV